MGTGSGSGSASGSAGYSATGAGYSATCASPGADAMYAAPIAGIEARLTITPLAGNGVGYQSLPQQLYQPLAGSNEQYLTCPQCGSDVPYGSAGERSGSEMSPPAMSALARVMQQAMLEAVKEFYRKACPACMTGKGMHTCGR